jgi:hypothetical protein
MLEIGALAVLVAGASYGYSLYLKGRAHTRFKVAFEEVARKLGGRTSPGTIFDAPELRLTIGKSQVLLRLRGIEHPDRGVAIVEVPLESSAISDHLRLYIGWDVASVPRGLEHIPEIPFPRVGLEGRLVVRASDAPLATRFVERTVADLAEMKKDARARAIEVLIRGGSLQLAVHGVRDSSAMLERIVIASLRIQMLLGDAPEVEDARPKPRREPLKEASAPAADRIEAPEVNAPPVPCALCTDLKKPGEAWVRCGRCRAPYHHKCFLQATGCIEKDCHETRALAFDKASP